MLIILSVLVVSLPLVEVLIVARPPRLTPLVKVVPFFFHTKVNGAPPVSFVVKLAVAPSATVWFDKGVEIIVGTHNAAVSVLLFTVMKFVPDTWAVFETDVAVGGLVKGLFTVTWNLTMTDLPAGNVPMLTFTGGTGGAYAALALLFSEAAPS